MKLSKNITYIEVINMERIKIGIRHPRPHSPGNEYLFQRDKWPGIRDKDLR